jgi:hypothetical protein
MVGKRLCIDSWHGHIIISNLVEHARKKRQLYAYDLNEYRHLTSSPDQVSYETSSLQ